MNVARMTLRIPLAAALCWACPGLAGADEPKVDRIGPPSWWVTAEPQQISLLIEGTGLDDARVRSSRAALRVDRVEPGLDGRALFVDATIAPGAEPGPVELEIEAEGRRMRREWSLVPRPDRRPQPLGPDDVIYLLMPDRFANGDPSNDRPPGEDPMLERGNKDAYHGGDFRGIREKLPYLADLGVTAIWLTPVYRQGTRWVMGGSGENRAPFAPYHGYQPIDFYDTNPRFGSLDEYRELVAEAHRLGLKVIQDQIVGYTGPHHPWVEQPPAEGWFHGPIDKPPSQTFRFDLLADERATDADRRGVTEGWFFGILPDLATRDPRVRRYAIQQSLWWVTMGGADGVRLDTYPMVERDFWRDWDRRLKALDPDYLAVGEAWTADPKILGFFQGGRAGWDGVDPGVASVFDFPLHAAIAAAFTGKGPASLLSRTLDADRACPSPDLLVTFLDNHDTPRLTQTGSGAARARAAAAFLLSTRGIPQITWGDEIGLPPDVDPRRDFPGGFPGDPRDAFTAEGRTPDEASTFDAWRTLLHLRRETPAMRRGRLTDLHVAENAYVYLREYEGDRVVTALNLGDRPATLSVPLAAAGIERLFGEGEAKVVGDRLEVRMPPESAGIYRANR